MKLEDFQMSKSKPVESRTRPEADETKTMDVPKAGKVYFGLGRDASYAAAKSGEIPVIQIGGRLRAVVPAIERLLARAGEPDAAA
jgi:hypothetical protein